MRSAPQAEVDRLIYDDPDNAVGFMLHPDMKWVCGTLPLCQAEHACLV